MGDYPLLIPPTTVAITTDPQPVLYNSKGQPLTRPTGFQSRVKS